MKESLMTIAFTVFATFCAYAVSATDTPIVTLDDTTLVTNLDYRGQGVVEISDGAIVNLAGRKLYVDAISGNGTIVSAALNDSPCAKGYTVLDYVQTPVDNSTTYLDTLYKPSITDRIETQVEFSFVDSVDTVFSARRKYTSDEYGCNFTCLRKDDLLRFDRNNVTGVATFKSLAVNTSYEVLADFGAYRYMVDNNLLEVSGGEGSFEVYTNILLFAAGSYEKSGSYEIANYAKAMKMHYFRVYDENGNLKVNMVPATKDGVTGFYDCVREIFIKPSVGELSPGNDISYCMISSVITPADNTGTYIDTDYKPHFTDRVETRIRFGNKYNQGVFSTRGEKVSEKSFTLYANSGKLRFDHYNADRWDRYFREEAGANAYVCNTSDDYEITMDGNNLKIIVNDKISVDELHKGPDNENEITDYPLTLFCLFTKGSVWQEFASSLRMYFFRVVDKYGYVRLDLIPAKRMSDGKIGFYDRTHNTFLFPASGDLFAGEELSSDITTPDVTYTASVDAGYGHVRNLSNNNFIYVNDDNSRVAFAHSKLPVTIDCDLGDGKAAVVNMYRVYGGGTYGSGCRSPKSWELYGSNDNEEWTLLDKRTNVTNWKNISAGSLADFKTYFFSNKISYRYLRLKVIEDNTNNKSNRYMELTQLEYFNIVSTSIPGELHLNIATGQEVSNSTVSLGGDLVVVKEGEGTFIAKKTDQFYLGGTKVKEGYLQYKDETSLGYGGIADTTVSAGAKLSKYGKGFQFIIK